MSSMQSKFAFGIMCFLLLLLVTGGIILAIKTLGNRPVEIVIEPPLPVEYTCEVNIAGDVLNPGIYSATSNDTILSLLDAAGVSGDASSKSLTFYIADKAMTPSPQKININTAELWLLQALPEIGAGKGQAIIDYRQRNGYFRNTYELQKVEGISKITFEKIKDLITVGDL